MTQQSKLCKDCDFWIEKGNLCCTFIDGKLVFLDASKERNTGLIGSLFRTSTPCGKGALRFSPKSASKPVAASNVFMTNGQIPLQPKYFGLAKAINARESTVEDAREMTVSSDPLLRKSLSAAPLAVTQIPLMALQTATYFVYISKHVVADERILTEIAAGVSDAFTKMLAIEDRSDETPDFAKIADILFRQYIQSLSNEVAELSNGIPQQSPVDMGATAALAVEHILRFCGGVDLIQNCPLERLRLTKIVARNGLLLLMRLRELNSITYVE